MAFEVQAPQTPCSVPDNRCQGLRGGQAKRVGGAVIVREQSKKSSISQDMVNFCGIVGCSNRSNRDQRSYYRLPKVKSKRYKENRRKLILERRDRWLKKIRRSDLVDVEGSPKNLDNVRICSDHFITGKHRMHSLLSV